MFVVEVVNSAGVLGGGVISGELSAAFCVATTRRVAIQCCAPAAAIAAWSEDVIGLAVLLRSAII